MFKLKVERIECNDLKNVELFNDKNDVFVTLDWRGTKFKTIVNGEAGSATVFKENDITIVPTSDTNYKSKLNPGPDLLKVQVWDENKYRPHVLIGEAEINISQLSESEVEIFRSDLKDPKKKNANTSRGEVVLHLLFESKGKFPYK